MTSSISSIRKESPIESMTLDVDSFDDDHHGPSLADDESSLSPTTNLFSRKITSTVTTDVVQQQSKSIDGSQSIQSMSLAAAAQSYLLWSQINNGSSIIPHTSLLTPPPPTTNESLKLQLQMMFQAALQKQQQQQQQPHHQLERSSTIKHQQQQQSSSTNQSSIRNRLWRPY
uniref:Vacuolar protein-sorting-associated protein 36-like n=1 Tax=Dermatophagoides pteronyssinus TaxID=6956 RepID=A0A6P6YK41_DERPT|nr:vacuolar protein-sorting-associated protein 36-like [Dermatophagoides pteronyssinus]